jgi:hypothetical protein
MTWWWESIHGANLYRHWSALAAFLDGTGIGRTQMQPARFAPDADATVIPFGVVAPDTALVWVLDSAFDWPSGATNANPAPVAGAAVTLTHMADGPWAVEWWDTLAGKRVSEGTAHAAAGSLRLAAPSFQVDLAARLKKR